MIDGVFVVPGRRHPVWLAIASLGVGGLVLASHVPTTLAVLVIILGIMVGLWQPDALLAAAMISLPLIYHPVAIGASRFSLLELSLVVGAVCLSLREAAFAIRSRTLGRLRSLAEPIDMTFVALAAVVVGVISLTTVADRRYLAESVRQLRVVIVEPTVALLLVRRAFLGAGAGIAAVAFLGAGVVTAMYALGEAALGKSVVIADGVSRVRGPYPHPNNLALFLDRAFILALGVALIAPRWRRAVAPAATVIGVALAASFSRGSILGVGGGVALLLVTLRPRRGWTVAIAAFAVLAVVALVAAPGRLTALGSTGTTSTRGLIWRSSLRMLRDHPWTGVGLDQFLYQYRRRYVSPAGWPERYTSHPHNLVLDVWLNLGVAGAITFAALAVVTIAHAWRATAIDAVLRPVVLVASAALLAGFLHGMVDNGFFLPDLATMTWSLIAVIGACSARTRRAAGAHE